MKEIQEHKIKIYEFPDTEDDEDSKLIRRIKVLLCLYYRTSVRILKERNNAPPVDHNIEEICTLFFLSKNK